MGNLLATVSCLCVCVCPSVSLTSSLAAVAKACTRRGFVQPRNYVYPLSSSWLGSLCARPSSRAIKFYCLILSSIRLCRIGANLFNCDLRAHENRPKFPLTTLFTVYCYFIFIFFINPRDDVLSCRCHRYPDVSLHYPSKHLDFLCFFQEKANSKNSIRLTSLTAKSSGQYKCEVSTEGPSFATEYKIGNLTVISELHSYLSQLSV